MVVWLSKLKWPYKVVILENTGGQGYTVSGRDKARLIKFGDGGEEIYFLKGRKKYKIGYGKKIGHKYIAWAIGDDGYWYNIQFENLDKKLSQLGVLPVDRDLRFATSSVRKGIDEKYQSKSFYEKWAVTITIGMLVFAIIANSIGMWYVSKKQVEVAQANAQGAETTLKVLEATQKVLSGLDAVSSNSGLKPS